MILVVGATGSLGAEICRRLVAKGKSVGALVRATSNPAKVDSLKSLGIALVQGDLTDRASLDAACKGVTTIISTASTSYSAKPDVMGVDHQGQLSLVDAAKAAGVSHFIYISFSGSFDSDSPLINAKRAVEQRLKASGMTYTIVRSSFFMEAMFSPTAGFDYPNAKAMIYGSGVNKISWIAIPDVAQFAVEAVDNPAARNAIIEVGGPEALSPLEVVKIFEGVTGKTFEVQHLPEEVIQMQLAQATDPLQKGFAGMMAEYAKGNPVDMQGTLQTYPVKLTSVKQYAERTLNAGAPG
jgi:uncharacterized protein YbjT (DUF2867 family)